MLVKKTLLALTCAWLMAGGAKAVPHLDMQTQNLAMFQLALAD